MRNRIQCLLCKEIIESKSVHDFVTCSCGNVSVDGGQEYCKVSFQTVHWKAINDEDLLNGVEDDKKARYKRPKI